MKMKKILFRFPFWYYLNPINFLGVGVLGSITYYNTVKFFSEIAEYEKFHVTHSQSQFSVMLNIVLTIILAIINILLYPYVFSYILKVENKTFPKTLKNPILILSKIDSIFSKIFPAFSTLS